jgi:uncharacterized protein (DUF1330 family)
MLLISVHLFANEGDITRLRVFELEALIVIGQFGGKLISAFKPANPENSANIPDEIHLLQFPSQEAFDIYRDSPESAALAPKRNKAIRKTIVYLSEEIVDY